MTIFDPGSLRCSRCGTPFALAVLAPNPAAIARATAAVSQQAALLSERLQHFQPGATIPGYVIVLNAAATAIDHVLLVWPEEHHSVLAPDAWANVPELLKPLHRCVPLTRLY